LQLIGAVARLIDRINEAVGWLVSWLALGLVLVQFTVVLMRYVFGIGSIPMQEGLIYMHATLFLVAAAYTLKHDGHVRVDIFYRGASATAKAWVDLMGSLVFLLPVMWVIWNTGFPYVAASWSIHEGSTETAGIQAVFLLKTMILVFAVLVAVQGISTIIHCILRLTGREAPPPPPTGEDAERI
jgi:TRAP-type mannitol/chloroaromatic compound transport system permease small subunit